MVISENGLKVTLPATPQGTVRLVDALPSGAVHTWELTVSMPYASGYFFGVLSGDGLQSSDFAKRVNGQENLAFSLTARTKRQSRGHRRWPSLRPGVRD